MVLRKGSDKAEIRVTRRSQSREGQGEAKFRLRKQSAKALGRYKLECSWFNYRSHKSIKDWLCRAGGHGMQWG